MTRFRTPIAAAYILSVVLVALGHCWPASPAGAASAQAAASHSHADVAHGAHGPSGGVAAETCPGEETACPVALAPPALLPALAALPEPAVQTAIPAAPPALAFAAPSGAFAPRGPPQRRTNSLHSYAEAFARTGRLLI